MRIGVGSRQTFKVTLHESSDGELPPLQTEWDQCLDSAVATDQLFTYEWYAAWTRTFTSPHHRSEPQWTGRCRVLVARDESGRAVGILPLALRRMKAMRCWSLAGCQSPLRSFPCAQHQVDEICHALARAAIDTLGWRDLLRLGPYGANTPARSALLRELQTLSGTALSFDLYRRIVVRDLPQTPEQLKALIKSRSSFQRIGSYERKFKREGNGEIHHYRGPDAVELARLMAECRAIEEASWLRNSSWPNFNFARGSDASFWPMVSASSLVPNGQFDLWIAYFNQQPVALRFALTCGTRRYAIANQYDEKFGQYGLGWLLYVRDLEDCVARGIVEIDMAMGNDDYKRRWGGEDDATEIECIILSPNMMGRAAAWLLRQPAVYRQIDKRIPGR